MRILFVSHTFPLEGEPLSNVGGMQRLAVEQAAALGAHPDVELFPLVLRSSSRWTPLRTVPFLVRLLRLVPRLVRRHSIDVVLFSSMVTAALAPLLRRRLQGTGAILAATPVGRDVTLPNPIHQRLVPRIFRSLDLLMPISRATASECLSRGMPGERLTVIPCGVDPLRFRGLERREAREALVRALEAQGEALPQHILLLCSVGRHQERKGFHWFVEQVMPRVPEGVIFVLGGAGPMTPRIRESVARLGLQASVRVLGQISEEMLLTLFRGSDLFVMPNVRVPGDIEGFGVVMLEAGLCGLPIIAADLEGIQDVVQEAQNGTLVESEDEAGFVAAIERFREDPVALREASDAAVRWTSSHFSWEVVVQRYVTALGAARRNAGVTV